jgi:hypothetical protein
MDLGNIALQYKVLIQHAINSYDDTTCKIDVLLDLSKAFDTTCIYFFLIRGIFSHYRYLVLNISK